MTTLSDTVTSREIRLASRPVGEPTDANFALASASVGPPGEGEVLVRTSLMSVEPYMRGRMNEGRSYVPPFVIGEPLSGAAVGEVVASRASDVPVGTTVMHDQGWREYAVLPGKRVRAIDISQVPAEAYLGALGTPGFTAWVGLRIIAQTKTEQTLFVSGAAGAVGSMVVQLAKRQGLTVIGSASSPQKASYVTGELGADLAFDYHDGPGKKLRELAPDGIDVYFDNVGGEQLEAALAATRVQRDRAGRPAHAGPGDLAPAALAGLHRHRPPGTLRRLRRRGRAADRPGLDQGADHGPGGDRASAARADGDPAPQRHDRQGTRAARLMPVWVPAPSVVATGF